MNSTFIVERVEDMMKTAKRKRFEQKRIKPEGRERHLRSWTASEMHYWLPLVMGGGRVWRRGGHWRRC